MVSVAYSEAAVEVLDILEHTKKEDVNKIPKKFIEFLENNKSKTYISNLDHTKTIKEMNLKPKTQALLGLIYLKYWANEEEKIEFRKKAQANEINYQKELNEKYNPNNLFKNKNAVNIEKNETIQQTSLVEIKKETIMQKIISKIKEIFRR